MSFYIDHTIYSQAPDSLSHRLAKEVRTYELLDKLDIAYTRVDHDPAGNIEVCEQVEQVLGVHICKNLFLCNAKKTKFYMLMMPGTKVFKTKYLSKQINSSRLSFAEDKFMEEFLDITPGSVSVLGLANDTEHHVQLVIDEDILKDEYIGCHPCINTSSLKIKTSDLLDKILPAMKHEYLLVQLPWEV